MLLDAHGLAPRRALGQNFMADANVVRKIVRLAGVGTGDRVVEVGAGLGSLTLALAETGATVTAIEADRHLLPALVSAVGAPEASHLTCQAQDRPVPDPWVVVTFGSSSCELSACPVGVDGPYPGHEAAKAASERLSFMKPHLLPLTGPPVLPLPKAPHAS